MSAIQTAFMTVDPAEIVIDMPISPANLAAKKASIAESGIVQPITLWIRDLRVIDGFHRAAAAVELGLKAVPAVVVDCSEEAFWDARIQSAKQHHGIEADRMTVWMLNCWQASALAQTGDRQEWLRHVYKANQTGETGESLPFVQWFANHAQKWGAKDWSTVASAILESQQVIPRMAELPARMTFEEAVAVTRSGMRALMLNRQGRPTEEEVQAFASEVLASGGGQPSDDYVGSVVTARDWLEKRRAAEAAAQPKPPPAPPISKEEARRMEMERAANLMEVICDRWTGILSWPFSRFSFAELLGENPQARTAAKLLRECCAEYAAMYGTPDESDALRLQLGRLTEENRILRRENKQRARLNERSVAASARSAMALSSADIENMPEGD